MYRLLYIVFLFVAVDASAQSMPERSDVRRGNRQFNKGNYEKSLELYGRALQSAPTSFEAGYNIGNALYKLERFENAEQTMQKVAADTLRTESERAEAFYNLGNAQFQQQKYKEALESYKQSLRLNPSDMEAKYNYAYTKRLLDENEDGGGGDNDKEQNQDQDQQQQNDQQQQDQDQNEQQGDNSPEEEPQGDSEQQPTPAGISEQQQEQMLNAIQAQEDRTQEKLKEKQGVVVRGTKNW